jgi:hypothetical protein
MPTFTGNPVLDTLIFFGIIVGGVLAILGVALLFLFVPTSQKPSPPVDRTTEMDSQEEEKGGEEEQESSQ